MDTEIYSFILFHLGLFYNFVGAQHGDLRLVGGLSEYEGRLEVNYFGSTWGSVCDDRWGSHPNNARVACKQLGFSGGEYRQVTADEVGTGSFLMDGVSCAGTETRLEDCPFNGWFSHDCVHIPERGLSGYEDVYLICEPTKVLRLVEGITEYEGKLEVYKDKQWGSVNGREWTNNNSKVACRQLGFSGGSHRSITVEEIGSSSFLLTGVRCQGFVLRLQECITVETAGQNEEIYLKCDPNEGDILRLIGGNNMYEGRLEIYHERQWRSICADVWTSNNSIIACKQLGFSGGSHRSSTGLDVGLSGYWMDDVRCSGSESRLEDCDFSGWGINDCSHSRTEDIYVICSPNTDGVLRLEVGDHQHEGRLEIYHDGEWGTVCVHQWDNYPQNAQVACRQLGYSGGTYRSIISAERPRTTVKFWIDELKCIGNETSLTDCVFDDWGVENCHHNLNHDVFLTCSPNTDGTMRLVNGSDQYEGRLEVYYAGEWGSVCIHNWRDHVLNAHVACRQLGLTGGAFRAVDEMERGSGKVWLDDVKCQGEESNLEECAFGGWGTHNCSVMNNEEILLFCNPNKGEIQLTNGLTNYDGTVEIFLGGTWNNVCGNRWGTNDATVACRQLGLNGGTRGRIPQIPGMYIWAVDVLCNSLENYLVDCTTPDVTCGSQIGSATCTMAEPYNSQCDPDSQCETNSLCIAGTCVCENTDIMFWNGDTHHCSEKSSYNEGCVFNNSESCLSNLLCLDSVDYPRCICSTDQYWDSSNRTCEQKLRYNDTCDVSMKYICDGNLTCQGREGSFRCLCDSATDQFWDSSVMTCKTKIWNNQNCRPMFDECTGDLKCLVSDDTVTYKCVCSDNATFWDADIRKCQRIDKVVAIYTAEKRTMSDAVQICKTEYGGRLATEDHLQNVFIDCAKYTNEIWLKWIPRSSNDMEPETLCSSYLNGEYLTNNRCSESKSYVCIVEEDVSGKEHCRGFPLTGTNSGLTDNVPSSSALIWWVIAAVGVLVLLVLLLGILLIRRRRRKYTNMKSEKENIGGNTHGESKKFRNAAFDSNVPQEKHMTNTGNVAASANPIANVQMQNEKSENENNAVYAVVNKQKKNDRFSAKTKEQVAHGSNKDDNVYDTFSDSPKEPELTMDDYSHIEQHNTSEDMYNTFTKPKTYSPADDTYDHLPSGAQENIYENK